MKWVLIVWLLVGDGSPLEVTRPVEVEFNTEAACQSAGKAIQKAALEGQYSAHTAKFVCVERG
jgi:hypothetical protein